MHLTGAAYAPNFMVAELIGLAAFHMYEFLVFIVLGWTQDLSMLGKHSTIDLHSHPYYIYL